MNVTLILQPTHTHKIMRKIAFSTFLCLLFALFGQAQGSSSIHGVVSLQSTGAPVPFHQVYFVMGDSLNGVAMSTQTDANGFYSFGFDVPPGVVSGSLGTLAYCDPASPFSQVDVALTNPTNLLVNFTVCNDTIPPFPNCFADLYFEPVDSLTFQFYGYYYSFMDTTGNQPATYSWDFGDGTTSTDQNPLHVYNAPGVYTVTLTATGADGCTSTITYIVDTSFNPGPDCFGYIMYNQTGTTSFDFSAQVFDFSGNSQPQITAYDWDFGDGSTSTDAAPSHTYAAEGVYTVQLHATTDQGCDIHACDVVFAFNCPIDTFLYGCQAMFMAGGVWSDSTGIDPTGGNPLTVSFVDLSLGGVTSWSWSFGDGTTSTDQNPIHTYAAEGTYTVSLDITTVDGCESSATFEICVGANCWTPEYNCQAMFIPIPDSSGTNGIQFLDISVTASPIQGWLWNFGDGTTSTDQNPYHVYAQPGIYTVSLTIEADSCYSVISFEVDTENPWNFTSQGGPSKLGVSATALSTKNLDKIFDAAKLFPNPAQEEISVAFNSKKAGQYELRINDLTGKNLVNTHQQAVVGVNNARVNISNLVPGLYLAEIRSGDAVQTIKFVKQ